MENSFQILYTFQIIRYLYIQYCLKTSDKMISDKISSTMISVWPAQCQALGPYERIEPTPLVFAPATEPSRRTLCLYDFDASINIFIFTWFHILIVRVVYLLITAFPVEWSVSNVAIQLTIDWHGWSRLYKYLSRDVKFYFLRFYIITFYGIIQNYKYSGIF